MRNLAVQESSSSEGVPYAIVGVQCDEPGYVSFRETMAEARRGLEDLRRQAANTSVTPGDVASVPHFGVRLYDGISLSLGEQDVTGFWRVLAAVPEFTPDIIEAAFVLDAAANFFAERNAAAAPVAA